MSNLKIYKASAGSGKTYTLALEYIKELLASSSDHAYRHLLAVTFTKDATGEMKDRILAELYGLAFNCNDSKVFMESVREALEQLGKTRSEQMIRNKAKVVLQSVVQDYSRLHITTIDSFFQKILRNLARELGKGSKFNLELNSMKVLSEAVHSLIEKANQNMQLLEWLTTYVEDKLDEGINWRIDREILHFSRCIFDEYFQEHEHILKKQLNDNPKIFGELKSQHAGIQKECRNSFRKTYSEINREITNLNLGLDDFSRKGVVITFLWRLANGDFAGAKMGKTIEDCCIDAEKWPSSKSKRKDEIISLAMSKLMPLTNQAIAMLRKFNTSRMITRNIHQLGLIWDITNEINEQNAENNRFMLADTALFLNRMIDESDAPFIYEKIGAEIHHVMIDEFQDTSRLQWGNFKSLLSNILANNYFSLIVGDVKQSIYRWRNGDWRILNSVEKELSAQSQTLRFNYRSEWEIIHFNNHFFTRAANLLNEKFSMLFDNQSSSPFASAYGPADVVQETKKTTRSGYVSLDFIADKTEDASYNELVLKHLIDQIKHLHESGIPVHAICILTRTNKSIIQIADYLALHKTDHPDLAAGHYLSVISNEAFQLNSSPAIKIIIEALRVIADPDNPVHQAQLEFYLKKLLPSTVTEKKDFIEDITQIPLFELIGYLFRQYELEQIPGQSSYMFTLFDAVSNYLKDKPADIPAFLIFWTEELQYKSVPGGTSVDGIRTMTIHKSKGLQFHTVLLPYCDWDLYPERNPIVWCGAKPGLYELELLPVKYSHAMHDTVFSDEYREETGQAWMDNLNILYVAFTRAEHNLIILARNKKKLDSEEDIKTVSDILQLAAPQLEGIWDVETMHFEKGRLDTRIPDEEKMSDNLLKQIPPSLEATFISKSFQPGKSIFKQSNKSREFINQEISVKETYVAYGNIMHDLFAKIETLDDVEKAVDSLLFEGLILPSEKQMYLDKVNRAINESNVSDWFSSKYKIHKECAILINEEDEITTKRPDRVLLSGQSTIIIDYKFGEARPAHRKQLQQYITLLQQMNYPNVEGYLWYVDERKTERIS